jgi:hypothetical protein
MKKNSVKYIGNRSARIIIPSRRADGQILCPNLRAEWEGSARKFLEIEGKFGGATPTEYVGSFSHTDGRVTREKITILEADTNSIKLEDIGKRDSFLSFGKEICKALGQECIFIGWGDDSFLVKSDYDPNSIPTICFKDLKDDQAKFLLMGWGGVDDPLRIRQLLSLDGWRDSKQVPTASSKNLQCVAELDMESSEGNKTIRAWAYKGSWDEAQANFNTWIKAGLLKDGDLFFCASREGYLAFGAVEKRRMIGPKELAMTHAQLNMVTRELLLSILHRDWARLCEYLKQKPLSEDFFPRIQALQKEIEESAKKKLKKHAFRFSVLVVGRMMFLRFLIEKGWVKGGIETLIKCFQENKKEGANFFDSTIRPIWFEALNTPEAERKSGAIFKDFEKIPYLNGGLFKEREWEKKAKLADDLFDPEKKGAFLQLLRDYEFSLNEYAGSDESLKVDPSIFGMALECFNSEIEKKNSGVHYTPKAIAMTLAMEGIINRLAAVTGICPGKIRKFSEGEVAELSNREAGTIREALKKLRIIDPAVGSGVLLWACLESLLTLSSYCWAKTSNSQGIERGSYDWGELGRHFVSNCLYGVDISEEAVELTRLRLWLAVALSESEPSPLPDLELNIVHGDSLDRDQMALENAPAQRELAFDKKTEILEKYKNAIQKYQEAADNPVKQAEHLNNVKSLRAELAQQPGANLSAEMNLEWDISFANVMQSEDMGFDLVIANPPYVRSQALSGDSEKYKRAWKTMASGNADLCYGFIELALSKLAAPDKGQIAFIQPAFAQNDSAKELRKMLVGKKPTAPCCINLWVDLGDNQVFPTATNYVSLLFAERLKQSFDPKPFEFSIPEKGKPWEDKTSLDWIRPLKKPQSHEPVEDWLIASEENRANLARINKSNKPALGEIADICVGIQTSADDVYLFTETRPSKKSPKTTEVFSEQLQKWVPLESVMLRACKKGAAKGERRLLFPYEDLDGDAAIIEEGALSKKFPLAYKYLVDCKKKLMTRKMSKSETGPWYRFGRSQGFDGAFRPKLLVPSILNELEIIQDPEGNLAFTASGKGGGGCWAVIPKTNKLTISELYRRMNTPDVWTQIQVFGSKQQGGWHGVDKGVLAKIKL